MDKLTVNSDKTYGEDEKKSVTDSAFYSGKDGKKLIAVELAPPLTVMQTSLWVQHIILRKRELSAYIS